MRKITVPATAAVAVLAVSTLAGCGSSGSDASATTTGPGSGKLEKTDLKVGGLPLADYATLYWAKDKGFFDKAGLNVTITPLQGGPVGVQEVAAGQLDFSFTNTISTAIAQSKGVPITTVVVGSALAKGEMGVFVKPDSPIKTITDLDGKKVGINTTNNMGDVTFKNITTTDGEKSAPAWVEVPFNEMVAGVKAGSIDAGYVPEPYQSQAKQAGLREVVDLSGGPNTNLPASSYIASNSFVKNDPNTVEAFTEAMYAANKDLQAKESDLRAWLPSVAGVDQQTASSMTLPNYVDSTDISSLSKVADMLKKQGLLPSSYDTAKYTYVPKG